MPDIQEFEPELRVGELAIRQVRSRPRRSSDNKRTTVEISNELVDRHGTIIDPEGGDLENYQKNPIFLINHDYGMVAGNDATVEMRNGKIIAQVDDENWDLDDPEIAKWHNKVKNGYVRAASIGFIPRKIEWEDEDGEQLDNPIIRKWELLEFSFVSVGSNPGALVTQRDLSKERQSLSELIPELRDVVNEMKGVISKKEIEDIIDRKIEEKLAQSAPEGSDEDESAPEVPERSAKPKPAPIDEERIARLAAEAAKRSLGKA